MYATVQGGRIPGYGRVLFLFYYSTTELLKRGGRGEGLNLRDAAATIFSGRRDLSYSYSTKGRNVWGTRMLLRPTHPTNPAQPTST